MKKILYLNPVFDFFIFTLSLYLGLWLRYNGIIPDKAIQIFLKSFVFISLAKCLIFYFLRIYKIIIKFMQTYDVINLIKGNFISFVLFVIFVYFYKKNGYLYPRSVIIIDFVLSLCFTVGLRYVEKYILYTRSQSRFSFQKQSRALIVGAGEAGSMVLREIRSHPESKIEVVGFIDDDKKKIGMTIGGKVVMGDRTRIEEIVKKKRINLIIIAIPSASRRDINEIIKLCENTGVHTKIVPSTYEIITGNVKFEQIRDIEIEDLISRDEIKLDTNEVEKYLRNRVILITGAGGSIGSEISRQVASFGPKKIVLLGKGENSIFNIHFELAEKYKNIEIYPAICDIRDKEKLIQIFKQFRPEVVFHAAAHKHVFLMELHPDEAFKNNVIGTLNLAEVSIEYNVKKFVLISTDKAVYPKSVMGMTKRIAEKIVLGLMQSKRNKNTKFMVVRFGNVLASRGSVVPIFKYQIEKGGPVTVTHPEVKRFFMTIPEAVQLVLQAASLGKGGEIFILNMGNSIYIKDLAYRMIKLSGYEPEKDIKIEYIGLKPGEKLEEQLFEETEKVMKTKYPEILKAIPPKINIKRLLSNIKNFKYKEKKLQEILKDIASV